MKILAVLARLIDQMNEWIGRGVAWVTVGLVLVVFTDVCMRYIFNKSFVFTQELEWHLFAFIFLIGAGYTLLHDGHVRVDVFYAQFSARKKAWVNAIGSLVLGLPLCWTILSTGMWQRGSSINSPLRSFEISQSGYGMYVKYLMAGFLVVFAVSMIIQFMSYFLNSVATLRSESNDSSV